MYDYADVFEVVRCEPKDFRQAGPAGGGSSTPSRLKAAGVRRVVIVPDTDEGGRAHGRPVAGACADAGSASGPPSSPTTPRTSAFAAAGRSRSDLLDLMEAAEPYDRAADSVAPRAGACG